MVSVKLIIHFVIREVHSLIVGVVTSHAYLHTYFSKRTPGLRDLEFR